MKEISKIKNRSNFCASPWIHIHTLPDGNTVPCCLTPMNDGTWLGNLNEKPMKEIWNSDRMKQLRVDMIDGVKPESCKNCYIKEKTGFSSLRTSMNFLAGDDIDDLLLDTKEDGHLETIKMKRFDFRFSNHCNLACVTCGPTFSSKWATQHIKVYGSTGIDGSQDSALIRVNDSADKDILKTIEEQIMNVEEIHFAGGEPMMMKEHWYIMDLLIANNRKDVKLYYSTNLTKLTFGKKNVLDYWDKLEAEVQIAGSIDGIEEVFEYIRYGEKWETVLDVINQIRDFCKTHPKVYLGFHPTISVLNIMHLDKLINFFIENEFGYDGRDPKQMDNYYFITLNPLIFPSHYRANNLPPYMKEIAKERISKVIHDLEKRIPIWKKNGINQGLRKLLMGLDEPPSKDFYKIFNENIKMNDSVRKVSLAESIPELGVLLAP